MRCSSVGTKKAFWLLFPETVYRPARFRRVASLLYELQASLPISTKIEETDFCGGMKGIPPNMQTSIWCF